LSRRKPSKLQLDVGLEAERGRVMGELSTGTQCRDHRKEKIPIRPSAPMLTPMDQDDSSKESWPWFSGRMKDLSWFRPAWEDHVRQFCPELPEKSLIERMRRYCVTISIGKVIEGARNLLEMWLLLETHFDRQTAFVDGLLSQLLKTERVVNDAQIISYYDKVLQAIKRAEELSRMRDLLTPNQIKVLLTVLPRKEANYWRMDQLNISMEDLPLAFYSFVKRSIHELRSNAASAKPASSASQPCSMTQREGVWKGSCVMGSLCGKNHMPELCNLFDELPP
jgi:hypothetical protein